MNYKIKKSFPKDFLWGASTSAFQVEGGYLEDGKGLSVKDIPSPRPGITDTKMAADHYHRFKEDVALMAELGLKTYRFSISWPRVFPKGNGEVNEKGLQFYDDLIDELLDHNIIPLVTILHFDLPQALVDLYSGWLSRQSIEDYVSYAKVLFQRFGHKVKYWQTINEQNISLLIPGFYGVKDEDPDKWFKMKYQMHHNMCVAQSKAILSFRELCPEGKIGPAPAFFQAYPASSDPQDTLAAHYLEEIHNWLLLDLNVKGEYPHLAFSYLHEKGYTPEIYEGDLELMKKATPDFIAFNYYGSKCVSIDRGPTRIENLEYEGNDIRKRKSNFMDIPGLFKTVENPYLKDTKTEWMPNVDPMGLRMAINKLYDRYRLPLIITENGFASTDILEEDGNVKDLGRIDYVSKHLKACHDAINNGAELFGYCVWSFMDLLSTSQGFGKRYGLVYINRSDEDEKDLARIPKKSFYWYQGVIKNNGENL
ncbi:6-phospho-beta-glucosidase [Anaerovirgula multivorans]|uniref:6-phospho-beta-glucosidase n=1 Tax=Anaerovirgula multivorans TaxID=312168 RepID=A0A239IR78_9FIRM|nr:glycoside hydrolase family 1 protein [Anaerovirgula multivorans]SNS96067.1 6-phospho-beta-glucosidase [Anaerovirgula multivorans]